MNANEKEKIILKKIADHFNQYLKQGKKFDYTSFSQDAELNLNIENIQRLLRIHFVLTKTEDDGRVGIIDFIAALPERLRRFKTTVKLDTTLLDGEVKGNIEWYQTFQRRYQRDPNNKTLFVCNQTERDYDIPENLVLKELLRIIYTIIYEDLQTAIKNEYNWIHDWTDETQLKEILKSVFLKNVYLKRITLEKNPINERMIVRAMKSRLPLYREAAELLSRYNKLSNSELDDREAQSLLKNTFIKPNKIETLFELYWIIEIIHQFKDVHLELLEEGNTCVATWKHNGYNYEIYHNCCPDCFVLKPNLTDPKNLTEGDYFIREYKVIKKYEQLTDKGYFGTLRPDIVLIRRKNLERTIDFVLVGEVKYTTNENYALQGLWELLTYVSLLQEKDNYVDKDLVVFSSSGRIKGCLFLDDISNFTIKSDDCISCMKFGEPAEKLRDMIPGQSKSLLTI